MDQVDTKKKVLIVDDEPNVRRLSRKILSNTFDVVEAEDGKQAGQCDDQSANRATP